MWIPLKSKPGQIKSALRTRPLGLQFTNAFGQATANAVIDIIADHHITAGINAGWSKTQCLTTAETILQLELNHGTGAGQRVGNLLAQANAAQLAPNVAGGNIMPIANYGALVGDADDLKAAKWIVNASNSLGPAHIVPVQQTLQLINNNNVPINTMGGLIAINTAFNFAAGPPPFRGVDMGGGQLPAPPTGTRLLNLMIQLIAGIVPGVGIAWQDLACFLLGSVIRCHGFPDQNGRTGRALYAICLLRGGVAFNAITNAHEQTLHQL